jgi:hypothetical protein
MKTWNIADKEIFKYDEYSHWIDYISYWIFERKIIEIFFTDRIFDLDTDNSNFWVVKFHDELLSITKYSAPSGEAYLFSCTYETISIPIFVITEFSTAHSSFCNNQRGITHFYGAFYRLIELWHFSDDFLIKINTIFQDCPITRLDYRFDFCSFEQKQTLPLPEEVLPNIRSNKKRRLYYRWARIQSWDVWNKDNKTIFIRLYNKLDELWWNIKKTYLYSDVDKFNSFYRLEYEFWIKWCAWFLWKDVDELVQKAFSTSWLEKNWFHWNLYKPTLALDLSDKIDKLRYIKIFRSMAKNLKKNWVNPYLIIEEIWL